MRSRSGFTLIEIMIVVAIIALVAVIAVPSFMRARERARMTRLVNSLRVAVNAFELYAAENHTYPEDVMPGIFPPEMETYFDNSFSWTGPTPLGGRWDWDRNALGLRAAVSVWRPDATAEQMLEIDRAIDDGNLESGAFQHRGGSIYSAIIEP